MKDRGERFMFPKFIVREKKNQNKFFYAQQCPEKHIYQSQVNFDII